MANHVILKLLCFMRKSRLICRLILSMLSMLLPFNNSQFFKDDLNTSRQFLIIFAIDIR